jgi:hypothetical protein
MKSHSLTHSLTAQSLAYATEPIELVCDSYICKPCHKLVSDGKMITRYIKAVQQDLTRLNPLSLNYIYNQSLLIFGL